MICPKNPIINASMYTIAIVSPSLFVVVSFDYRRSDDTYHNTRNAYD